MPVSSLRQETEDLMRRLGDDNGFFHYRQRIPSGCSPATLDMQKLVRPWGPANR